MSYTGIRVHIKDGFTVGSLVGAMTPWTETLEGGKEYTFQFKIINYTSTDILNHIVCIDGNGSSHMIIDSISISGGTLVDTFTDEGVVKNEYLCSVVFTIPSNDKFRFAICRNSNANDKAGLAFDIREVSCEKGSMLSDYKDNQDDINKFIKEYRTEMEQTKNAIEMLAKAETINYANVKIEEANAKIDLTAENILLEVDHVVTDVNAAIDTTKNDILGKLNTDIESVTKDIEGLEADLIEQVSENKQEILDSIDLTKAEIISECESKIDVKSDSILLDVNTMIEAKSETILSEVDNIIDSTRTEILSETESMIDLSKNNILLQVDSKVEMSKADITKEVLEQVEDGVVTTVENEIEKARVEIITETQSKIDVSKDNILLQVDSKISTSKTEVIDELNNELLETETRLTSKIDTSADNILLEVAKKTDNDSIISSINMSPETIQINASQIDMTGNLDLNGTFKCYRDGANKTGHYLYQSGAVHRGYLNGRTSPTFSSGIWSPDGTNEMGYVSVGYTNSDNVDNCGCLYMSPDAGGGAHLYFSRLKNGSGVVSGVRYGMDGTANYYTFMNNRHNVDYYSHVFDGGVSCYDINANNVKINKTLWTEAEILNIWSGGWNNQYGLHLQNNGYFFPQGSVQLGTSPNPFYQLYSTYAPQIVSDARKKTNVKMIASATSPMTLDLREPVQYDEDITIDDMYDHIKEIPLVSYELIERKEEEEVKRQIGFLAQDIMDSPAGRFVVNTNDEDNICYDMGNRITVLEGALKKAIEKIEILESIIYDMYEGGE